MPRRSTKFSQRKLLPRDIKGWINASKYLPETQLNFELLMLMDHEGRQQQGWWDGSKWDFHPQKISVNIIKWRFLDSTERCMND